MTTDAVEPFWVIFRYWTPVTFCGKLTCHIPEVGLSNPDSGGSGPRGDDRRRATIAMLATETISLFFFKETLTAQIHHGHTLVLPCTRMGTNLSIAIS